MGDAEVFGARIGSVGGVIDNADVKQGGVEIDDGALGRFLIIDGFGNSREVRTGFHFDDGKIVLRILFK